MIYESNNAYELFFFCFSTKHTNKPIPIASQIPYPSARPCVSKPWHGTLLCCPSRTSRLITLGTGTDATYQNYRIRGMWLLVPRRLANFPYYSWPVIRTRIRVCHSWLHFALWKYFSDNVYTNKRQSSNRWHTDSGLGYEIWQVEIAFKADLFFFFFVFYGRTLR